MLLMHSVRETWMHTRMQQFRSLESNEIDTKAKWMIFIVYLLLIGILVLVALFVIYLYFPHLLNLKDDRIYCERSECLKAAWRITDGLDLSSEPCDSFYQFSCGSCAKNICHVEKGDPIENLITEPIRDEEQQPLLSLKKLYQTCNSLTGDNQKVDESFWSLIKDLGGWPILEGSKWKSFNLKDVILKCYNLGVPYEWIIGIGRFRTWWEKLEISAPTTQNPFLKDALTESLYTGLIDKTAELMGASGVERLDVKEIVHFEKKVNQLTEKYEGLKQRPFRLRELKKIIPRIDLQDMFQNVSENDIHDDSYIFSNYLFLKDLSLLLASTPERTQANYFIWKIIQYFGMYLSDPVGKHFRKVLSHSDDRSSICTEDITSRFPHTVGMSYVKEYLDDEKLQEIQSVFDNVKEAFIKRVKNIYWIDPLFRNSIELEIEEISIQHSNDELGIPEEVYEITPETNSTNVIDMIRQQNIYKRVHLLPSERWTNYYGIGESTGDPQYYFVDRKIVIPMPIILSQYYSSRNQTI
nr:unnamed protein product [Callosobruchus chinensis]